MVKKTGNRSFYKYWYLKLNDPNLQRALWIRFTVLSSRNGFKQVAELWAVYFQRISVREIKKIAVKQTLGIEAFSESESSIIRLGDCELSQRGTRGIIQSKGQSIRWDLSITPERDSSFDFIPKILSKFRLIKNKMNTDSEEILFSGTTEINGEKTQWKLAPGMTGHLSGRKNPH